MALSCIIASCKKEKVEEQPATPATNLLIRSVTEANTNDSLVRTFTYDANNRVTVINQTANPSNAARTFTFSYNPNGSLAYYDDNIFGRYRLTYNAAGKVDSKKTYTVNNGTETLSYSLIYTYNGSVVTENYTPQPGIGSIEKYTFDGSGNLITVNSYLKSSPTDNVGAANGTSTYSNYDNKKNNEGGFPSAVRFPSNSVNNEGSVVYTNGSYSYTYLYNADGYVTKRTDNGGYITLYQYRRL